MQFEALRKRQIKTCDSRAFSLFVLKQCFSPVYENRFNVENFFREEPLAHANDSESRRNEMGVYNFFRVFPISYVETGDPRDGAHVAEVVEARLKAVPPQVRHDTHNRV